jgi:ferredoxin--NADP+ reductase
MLKHPNYTYHALATRDALGPGGKKYIQDLMISGEIEQALGEPLDPATTHVFLCGNPAMIGAPEKDQATGELKYPAVPGMIELLERRGFTTDQPAKKVRGNIHFEKYW